MATKILAIDKRRDVAMQFISNLPLADAAITFVDKAPQAIKNIKRVRYDLILVGDRVDDGDTFDIGLAIEGSKRNRKTPTVCVGHHAGRAARLMKLLGSSSLRAEPNDFSVAVAKVKTYLEKKEERSLAGTP